MYSTPQIETLFTGIETLASAASSIGGDEGFSAVPTAGLKALLEEVRELKALKQRLLIGRHEHRHGESTYLFLVPQRVAFGTDDFAAYLQEDYEPEHGEQLTIDLMDEPTVVDALDPRRDALEAIGYGIEEDAEHPGQWVWLGVTDVSDPFDTEAAAVDAAWADAVEQTLRIKELSRDNWDALAILAQCKRVTEALGGDAQ